jgi:hypothetical protein
MRHWAATLAVLAGFVFTVPAMAALSEVDMPATTTCHDGVSITVKLDAPAPEGGLAVSLTSSNPAVIGVPLAVAIAKGQFSITMKQPCVPKTTNTAVTITATAAGITRTDQTTVIPPFLQSITLGASLGDPTNVPARVTIAAPAAADARVALFTSNPAAATLPSQVIIPTGQTQATFNITTIPAQQTATSTISAIIGTVTRTATLTVPGTATGTITDGTSNTIVVGESAVPASVLFQSGLNFVATTSITGGQSQQARVTLNRTAGTGGVTVTLSSNKPRVAAGPPSVTVAAGQTFADFTVNSATVAQSDTVIFTASVGATGRSATLTINPASQSITDGTSNTFLVGEQPVPSAVTFAFGTSFVSSKTITGGQSQQARVTLTTAAGTGGLAVTLQSSNPAVASVPASVTVPAGQTSALFNVTTVQVNQPVTVNINAIAGNVIRSAALTVSGTTATDGSSNTAAFSEQQLTFAVTPSQVQGGSSATGKVSVVSNPAGLVVKITTAATDLTFPRSITLGAGETTKTFLISTAPVAVTKQAAMTAVLDQGSTTISRSAQLAIVSPQITALTISQDTATANTTITGKVGLDGPAADGLSANVSSSDTFAAGAAGPVSFVKGSTTGTFSLLTGQVKAETTVKITVKVGGAEKSVLLRVTP